MYGPNVLLQTLHYYDNFPFVSKFFGFIPVCMASLLGGFLTLQEFMLQSIEKWRLEKCEGLINKTPRRDPQPARASTLLHLGSVS